MATAAEPLVLKHDITDRIVKITGECEVRMSVKNSPRTWRYICVEPAVDSLIDCTIIDESLQVVIAWEGTAQPFKFCTDIEAVVKAAYEPKPLNHE